MPQIFRSLRFRLLLIVLLALLPAFGLAIVNASEQRQRVQDRVQEDTLKLAHVLANHQQELVEGTRQLLFVLAQLPVIRGEDTDACTAYLGELKKNNPRYMNILKWDLDGNLLCDAGNSPKPHQVLSIDSLHKVLDAMDFLIINFVISPHTSERALSFGYPILDEKEQPQAVLYAALHLDSIHELLSKAELPDGSILTLRDRNGIVLARSPYYENLIGLPDPDMLASPSLANLEGEGTLETRGADGISRLYAYTPVYSIIPEGLYLIVGIPSTEAMAVVEKTLQRSLFILALAGFVALIAIWLGGEIFFLRPVQKLLVVTRRMTAGDLSARTEVSHEASELTELAQSFDQMAKALETRENECYQAQDAILKQERDRAHLLHQLITANEDERMRIARELHDETSQNLTTLLFGLDTTSIALEKDPRHVAEHLDNVKLVARELLKGIHHLIYNLRPPLLDDLGLVPTIYLCADKQLKPQGITMHLYVNNQDNRLSPYIETAIFRIVQEAFTNIIRHSYARRVDLRLTYSDHSLQLEVIDDGQGFDAADLALDQPGGGFGLRGMQERVRMLDGQLEVESIIGEGTKITVNIPLPKIEGELV